MAKKSTQFTQNKVWLDPCAGIGNLSYWLVKYQKDPEYFIKNNLILVDRDELALFIARFILVVHFQDKERNLYEKIKNNFLVADFLTSANLPKYDYAILNPPYVMTAPDDRFETSTARDLYAYFLEKVIKTTEGFISITPQTFTNGQKFRTLRQLLISHFTNLQIYCFDNVPDTIFRGIKFGSKNTNTANSTRAGIIIANKNKTTPLFQITPLLRWRVKDRQQLLDSIDHYLTTITPRADIFPKITKKLLPLYRRVLKQERSLAHITTGNQTSYKLTIPSTPRYFISALKCSVERSSSKTLYFYTEVIV